MQNKNSSVCNTKGTERQNLPFSLRGRKKKGNELNIFGNCPFFGIRVHLLGKLQSTSVQQTSAIKKEKSKFSQASKKRPITVIYTAGLINLLLQSRKKQWVGINTIGSCRLKDFTFSI